MMNIILWLSIIWLAPLMCFVLGNEAKFKKNIAVGVTLPYEGRQDSQVLVRLSRFKKELGVMCLFLLLLALPCMLVKGLAGNMALWFLWLDLCVFLPFIPYVRCNRELKRVKRDRHFPKHRRRGDSRIARFHCPSPGETIKKNFRPKRRKFFFMKQVKLNRSS